ncbi:MAG: prolipoprotein diacylglyceryl transferase [Acidimicrobiia bacterium]|nr:prolipoprotein diacylglyceryl transferase [Acidimicrobiia bacterium]
MLASLSYPPVPIFEIGPLQMSLHGLFAGVGFVVGALLMLREARRRGYDEDAITSVLTWALVGAILGARLFTVPAHLGDPGYGFDDVVNPAGFYSIMGGFAGGILVGLARIRMIGMASLPHLDMAAFGLAIGTVVGRIGDIFIVEHLGGPTSFFLGYELKPGYDVAPQHDALETLCETTGQCGPYHHAALYDLLGAAVLLGVLYLVQSRWAGRLRYGMLFTLWVAWYGFQRFLIDFTRNTEDFFASLPTGIGAGGADATLGPFTWSQWSGLALGLLATGVLVWLARAKPTDVVTPSNDRERGADPPGLQPAGEAVE